MSVTFNPIAEEAVVWAATVSAFRTRAGHSGCFLWEELCRHKHRHRRVVMLQMELLAVFEESADIFLRGPRETHSSWNTAAESASSATPP